MKALTFLMKPASSACNMRCGYCFYADVSAHRANRCLPIMTENTLTQLLENIRASLSSGDAVCFVFQGGEPTLAGLPFYRRFFSITAAWEHELRVSYAFQTNGLLLDDDWCRLLRRPNLLMGVSLDLPFAAHDALRRDASGNGTSERVRQAIALLHHHGMPFNVLSTLTKEAAAQPEIVWKALRTLDIPYIQFTPCIGALDGSPSPHQLTPEGFASFYKVIFYLWASSLGGRKPCSVKLFDDLIELLVTGRTSACGLDGRCLPQLVVEADGSVYPCDFYCTDDFRSGNLLTDSLESLLAEPSVSKRLQRVLPSMCGKCAYWRLCGGGCPRMRDTMCIRREDFCGYADFLHETLPPLTRIAAMLRKQIIK